VYASATLGLHSSVIGQLELSKRKIVDNMNCFPLQSQNQLKMQIGWRKLLSVEAAREKKRTE